MMHMPYVHDPALQVKMEKKITFVSCSEVGSPSTIVMQIVLCRRRSCQTREKKHCNMSKCDSDFYVSYKMFYISLGSMPF